MKRYIILLLAAVALCGNALAQKNSQTILGAKVDIQSFEYQADSVKIELDYILDSLKIGVNQSVIFTPTIFTPEQSLELPTVVVKRRGGAKSYERAVKLDNQKSLAEFAEHYGEPYKVVDYYGKDKQYEVKYSFAAPYEQWMAESQLYLDCTTYGCCSSEGSGVMIPANNKFRVDMPKVESFAMMPEVELIKPEKVAIKRRDIQYSAALIFRVSSTVIDPKLANNSDEIASIDEMMQSVISDSDYTITKVNIIGFASPEGTLANNMRLSKGRAAALESLMKHKYKMIAPDLYNVEFGGENWGKLYEIVEESDIDSRDEILRIIREIPIEKGRETALMRLNGGATYKYLLRTIFPTTRLVLIDVEYNVDAYDLVRIGELIDTKPQNLSLEEMYRLSETYDVSDKKFEKIFQTAAMVYPDDEVAQNNALVTEIRTGNLDSVAEIAARVDCNTESAELANSLGAYYMMVGDYDQAESLLSRAIELGSERGEQNMAQLRKQLDNLQKTKERDALHEKIYGK